MRGDINMVKIAPSILSANFAELGRDVERLSKAGAEFIHIDVMDGHFVPNISFGMPIIKSIRDKSDKIFDVHLMIENPSKYIDDFIEAGADMITVHYESEKHLDRTIQYIKSKGKMAAVALNPATPVSLLKNIISELDMVLIMTVNPGFGGQKFIQYTVDKVKEVKELSDKYNKNLMIQVDGGIDSTNVQKVIDAGANVIVAGSAVFDAEDPEKVVHKFIGGDI